MTPAQRIAAIAEKAIATYVEAFITLLLVHPLGASTAQSAAIAAIPALLTFLLASIPTVPAGLSFWWDLFFRTARTFAVTWLGFLLAIVPFHLDRSVGLASLAAAGSAALAVLKAGLASFIGNRQSAALLPAKVDTPVPVAP